MAAFLQRLEAALTGGWRRDRDLETRLHGMGVGGEGAFCFSCAEAPGRPAAALGYRRGPEEWYVSNIVPLGRHTLSDEEYNHILGEFESRFLEPLSRGQHRPPGDPAGPDAAGGLPVPRGGTPAAGVLGGGQPH